MAADHPLLMIPGPIEFSDEVLAANAHPSMSHVGPQFVKTFGETLTMLRRVFGTRDPASQPFVLSGSGTLGWDSVAANVTEPGQHALVLHTGYFADSFADWYVGLPINLTHTNFHHSFSTYGVKATQLKAPIGKRPSLPEIEQALRERTYSVITITHVDTSTGVLSDVRAVAELVHRVSPDTLIVVDGVCSVGCEELQFDDWKLDVVLTASQKALGCPAGLSVVMASGRAVQRFTERKTPPGSYFASWAKWIPVMKAYEAQQAKYFATPAVQLVYALHTSLQQILSVPLAERYAAHRRASDKVKAAVRALGLEQLPASDEQAAHGMTAVYLPNGLTPAQILPRLAKHGVVFAGGLHKDIATKYIRIGHMGITATDPNRGDVENAIHGLKAALDESKAQARL